MPFTLTTPRTIDKTFDTLDINSVTIDWDNKAFHISFDWGNMVDSVFVVDIKDVMLTIDGVDWNATWTDMENATAPTFRRQVRKGIRIAVVRVTGEVGTET